MTQQQRIDANKKALRNALGLSDPEWLAYMDAVETIAIDRAIAKRQLARVLKRMKQIPAKEIH